MIIASQELDGGTGRDAAPLLSSPEEDSGRTELLQIVIRARAGDLRAQSDLVQRYRSRLAGFVRPMVRDRESAKDTVQAISLKMIRRLPALRNPAVFEPWLFTLARNTALDQLRQARCRPVLLGDDPRLHDCRDPSAEDRSREILEVVERALQGTSAANRRILEQVMEGANYRQVARAEGISLAALKVRLHRLRQELRQQAGWSLGHLLARRPARSAS